jgi:hypothetical protein
VALEIENNLVAGVRFNGAAQGGGILAQYGIASVVRNNTGQYTVTTVDSLGDAEDCDTCAVEPGGQTVDRVATHLKTGVNTWAIYTWGPVTAGPTARAAVDATWSFKVFRIATGR